MKHDFHLQTKILKYLFFNIKNALNRAYKTIRIHMLTQVEFVNIMSYHQRSEVEFHNCIINCNPASTLYSYTDHIR